MATNAEYFNDDMGGFFLLPVLVYNDTEHEPDLPISKNLTWLGLYARVAPHMIKHHHPRCDCHACCVVRYYQPDLWSNERK